MKAGTKKCTKCGEVKPLDLFSRDASGAQGRMSACKVCRGAANAVWQRANPERCRARNAAHRRANSERVLAAGRARYAINLEKERARGRAKNAADPEKVRARSSAWYAANSEKVYANTRLWHAANPEKVKASVKAWRKANPEKVCEYSAERRARKLQACPAWADNLAIAEIYVEAEVLSALTGIKHNVDHIVPLKSKLVSGLHVEFNLRAIPKLDNLKKGNRIWPDMP